MYVFVCYTAPLCIPTGGIRYQIANMLLSNIFGKSRYLCYINRIQNTYCEPRRGSNDAQSYTVACITHTMCTVLWPSRNQFSSFIRLPTVIKTNSRSRNKTSERFYTLKLNTYVRIKYMECHCPGSVLNQYR